MVTFQNVDYAAVALLALLDFADSTGNTSTAVAEGNPTFQPLPTTTIQSTPAADTATNTLVSRQRRAVRSGVWDDLLGSRSSIDLSDGDHPSLVPSTELSTHEPGVPTGPSQSPPQTDVSVPSRSCDGTDESMRLSDAD
ncbi:hypothetical protein FBUS_08812 [Fasciolopsis buskii]|uniref:Uncharacterized protein n=1 Tax=Fasciolopsis buskii TaxID=27845 RepID=A0A8E0RPZ0_9TREM|nr:hypothetical protein FBUS_08812 [Fasciolopsis buski]